MTSRRCPFPNCQKPVPADPTAVFCLDHYFALPRKEASFITRLQIDCRRCLDEDKKQHLREQIPGYINAAVRVLCERTSHVS